METPDSLGNLVGLFGSMTWDDHVTEGDRHRGVQWPRVEKCRVDLFKYY